MNWCKNIFIWLLGFVAAVLFFSIPKFDFSYEIKVVDVLGILVTLLVAFLIQLYLVKRGDANKVEKDIIIDQAKTVRSRFENVRDVSYELYLSQIISAERNKKILTVLKSLGNSIETFEHSFVLSKKRFRCQYRNVRLLYFAYKRELTNLDLREPISEKNFQMAEVIFNNANREITSIILIVNQG